MAITYVGSASSTNSTTIDLSGLSLQENDYVVVASGADAGNPALPTGYSQLGTTSSIVDLETFAKRMGSTPDTQVSGLTAESDMAHIAMVFRGVDTVTAIDATTTTTTSSGDPNSPSITTVTDGALVISVGVQDDDIATVSAGPSGYTLVTFGGSNQVQAGVGGNGCTMMAAYVTKATAGAEDPGVFTSSGNDSCAGHTIALRPVLGPSITAFGDNSEPDTRQNVTITGTSFGASDTGSAKVELGSTSDHGTATLVELPRDSWSATSIQVDIEATGTGNPVLDTLTAGTLYAYVTDSSGTTGPAFAVTIKEPGATWAANLNTKASVDVSSGNVTMRLRTQTTMTGDDASSQVFRLYASKNSAAYAQVTASTSGVKIGSSSHFADNDDTTDNLLSAGTLVANNNAACETVDGKTTLPDDFTSSLVVEHEYALEFIQADLADADNYKFRVYADTTAFDTYTNDADIDVVKSGGADHDLLANDLESASEAASPAIGQEHAILADDTQSTSELSSPGIGQEHALLADDAESATELSLPAIGQEHAVLADDVESASEAASPALGQEHALSVIYAESSSEITSPALSQIVALAANDVASTSELSEPALADFSDVNVLLADDIESACELTSPALGTDSAEILVDTHDGATEDDYRRYLERLRQNEDEYEAERAKLQDQAKRLRQDIEAGPRPKRGPEEAPADVIPDTAPTEIPEFQRDKLAELNAQLQLIVDRLAIMDALALQWQDDEDAMAALMLVA